MSGLNPVEDFHSHPFFGPVGLAILVVVAVGLVVFLLFWRDVRRSARESQRTRIVVEVMLTDTGRREAEARLADFDRKRLKRARRVAPAEVPT